MKFVTAYQDFVRNTLPHLAGTLDRLVLSAKLRKSEEEHWGLAKVHGEDAARSAVAQAHQELTISALSEPLHELSAELEGAEEFSPQTGPDRELAAPECPAPSKRHLNWILRVLAAARR